MLNGDWTVETAYGYANDAIEAPHSVAKCFWRHTAHFIKDTDRSAENYSVFRDALRLHLKYNLIVPCYFMFSDIFKNYGS